MEIKIRWNDPDNLYTLDNIDRVTTIGLPGALEKAAAMTRQRMDAVGLEKAAVCLSGYDSEMMVRFLIQAGIHVECWTYDVDGIFGSTVSDAAKVCDRYGVKHHVLNWSKDELIESGDIERLYTTYNARNMVYILHPKMFESIPSDYYIACGDGGLNRQFQKYSNLLSMKKWLHYKFDTDRNFYIPIDAYTQITTQLSLDIMGKKGNACWYNTCWDIWYHILKSPYLKTNYITWYEDSEVDKNELQPYMEKPIFGIKTSSGAFYESVRMQFFFINELKRSGVFKHDIRGTFIEIPKSNVF